MIQEESKEIFKSIESKYKSMLQGSITNKPFVCAVPGCAKSYTRKSRLQDHINSVHLKNIRFVCREPTCRKEFLDHGNLKIHQRLHSGVKPYPCRYCPKCFSTLGNRKDHERRHLICKYICYSTFIYRPYSCQFCSKSFYRRYLLVNHISSC